jgi:hypothetical protein
VFRKVESDQVNQFNSLPRQSTNSLQGSVIGPSSTLGPSREATPSSLNNNKRAVVFGKHFQFPALALRASGKRSTSAPNLGDGFIHFIGSLFCSSPALSTGCCMTPFPWNSSELVDSLNFCLNFVQLLHGL